MNTRTCPILDEVRLSYDGDAFGTVQEWRFAICDYLLSVKGYQVTEFSQGTFGPDEDSYAYQELFLIRPTQGDLLYALEILDRASSILVAMNKNY